MIARINLLQYIRNFRRDLDNFIQISLQKLLRENRKKPIFTFSPQLESAGDVSSPSFMRASGVRSPFNDAKRYGVGIDRSKISLHKFFSSLKNLIEQTLCGAARFMVVHKAVHVRAGAKELNQGIQTLSAVYCDNPAT